MPPAREFIRSSGTVDTANAGYGKARRDSICSAGSETYVHMDRVIRYRLLGQPWWLHVT